MIIFDPAKHAYTNSFTKEIYTGVSSILSKFKEEFDSDKFSRIIADRRGVSQQAVLDEWSANAKDAADYGTRVHKAIEEFAKTGIIDDDQKEIIYRYRDAGGPTAKEGALFEQLVYSHVHKIAGTSDVIYPIGGYFDVIDFKTNKKFNFFSKYEKFLYSPVDHLPECEYSSYALQLSLYAYCYQSMSGRKPRSLKIFYWNRDSKAFDVIPLPYLKSDVENILKKLPSLL
jgi:hypothetical protein